MKIAFFQMVTVPICVKKTVKEWDYFSYRKLMCVGFFLMICLFYMNSFTWSIAVPLTWRDG